MSDSHAISGSGSGSSGRSGVTLNLFRGRLVATLPVDLSGDTFTLFQRDLLDQLVRTRVKSVVFDCAGLEILDLEEFHTLGRITAMAELLGAKVILAGLRPGIVASLITMGGDLGKLRGALSLDDALQTLEEEAAGLLPDEVADQAMFSQEDQNNLQTSGGDHVE